MKVPAPKVKAKLLPKVPKVSAALPKMPNPPKLSGGLKGYAAKMVSQIS